MVHHCSIYDTALIYLLKRDYSQAEAVIFIRLTTRQLSATLDPANQTVYG